MCVISRPQFFQRGPVIIHPFALIIWRKRPADVRAFAPREAEPLQIFKHPCHKLRLATVAIQIVVAQDQRAAVLPRAAKDIAHDVVIAVVDKYGNKSEEFRAAFDAYLAAIADAEARRQLRTDRRDAFGRIVGQETNGGELVTLLADSALNRLYQQAWNRSDSHDMAVIRNELDRRAMSEVL